MSFTEQVLAKLKELKLTPEHFGYACLEGVPVSYAAYFSSFSPVQILSTKIQEHINLGIGMGLWYQEKAYKQFERPVLGILADYETQIFPEVIPTRNHRDTDPNQLELVVTFTSTSNEVVHLKAILYAYSYDISSYGPFSVVSKRDLTQINYLPLRKKDLDMNAERLIKKLNELGLTPEKFYSYDDCYDSLCACLDDYGRLDDLPDDVAADIAEYSSRSGTDFDPDHFEHLLKLGDRRLAQHIGKWCIESQKPSDGHGSSIDIVVSFTFPGDEPIYLKALGNYYSYGGGGEFGDWFAVKPQVRTITVYE